LACLERRSYGEPALLKSKVEPGEGGQMPGKKYLTNAKTTKEGFTGKERDKHSGLDYFGARYYDPALGKWLSVDPLADNYYSWSPYNYSMNDPINKYDPDGQFVWGAVIGAAVDAGMQVASGMASGQSFSEAVSNIDGTSVAISAAAGLASGGLSTLTKAYKAGKTIAAVGNAVISAGEGAAKAAASGQEISVKSVAMDAIIGGVASKAGDAVDSKITKTIQEAGDAGRQAGKATKKLKGTRTNSKTSRKTHKKHAAKAAKANAAADKAAKRANKAMTLENLGAQGAASATAGSTAGAVKEKLEEK
jgi:RHS repeat-associated protein